VRRYLVFADNLSVKRWFYISKIILALRFSVIKIALLTPTPELSCIMDKLTI